MTINKILEIFNTWLPLVIKGTITTITVSCSALFIARTVFVYNMLVVF